MTYDSDKVFDACKKVANPDCDDCHGIGIHPEDYGLVRCWCVDDDKVLEILENET